MMQEYHQELDNMRQRETRTPPWELVAFDADGNELYRTEYFESREEAQADADAFDKGDAYWVENISDEVDHFEPRQTE
jgi:hypothetical protein